MVFKLWTVLIILINIAAIVFPLLTMYLRRPDVSYAEMHEEVYPHAGPSPFLTADKFLYVCVFLWTIIFVSNTLLLICNLFHKYDSRRLHPHLKYDQLTKASNRVRIGAERLVPLLSIIIFCREISAFSIGYVPNTFTKNAQYGGSSGIDLIISCIVIRLDSDLFQEEGGI